MALLLPAFAAAQSTLGSIRGTIRDLLGGIADNGSTAVLGAGSMGSAEGFSAGRVVRVGLRLTL